MMVYHQPMSVTVNRENIEKWCQALESGEYPQTRGWLHTLTDWGDEETPPGYCCVGVACELAGLEQGLPSIDDFQVVSYDGELEGAPDVLNEWAGELDWKELYKMNDSGKSFTEIATHIRAKYLAES
jgi:hypothetical protein